jgi:hypothetical protein
VSNKKPEISVTPRSDEATWDPNDVIAKRLAGQPFGIKADQIPLREPKKWALRIANSQVHDSRHYDMVHRLGYVPLSIDDLASGVTPESLGFRLSEDGKTLCRGVRGDEVVYKMEKSAYDQIQMKKAEKNVEGMKSETKAKHEAAEAAASAHGSQAADYIAKHANITIKDSQQTLG